MNNYKDKYFSVLGDSISTLDGYTKPEFSSFYDSEKKIEAKVYIPRDTWWGQVADALGGKILENNSISGSTVCRHRDCEIQSYGASDERTSSLSHGDISPDVIMVYMGTNDWGWNMALTPKNDGEGDLTVFSVAYSTMLEKLKKNYPNAEIWCFTLAISKWEKVQDFIFPYWRAGVHINEYSNVIRNVAKAHACRIIDLYESPEKYDTIDGFHPNSDGMKTLSKAVLSQLGDDVSI